MCPNMDNGLNLILRSTKNKTKTWRTLTYSDSSFCSYFIHVIIVYLGMLMTFMTYNTW